MSVTKAGNAIYRLSDANDQITDLAGETGPFRVVAMAYCLASNGGAGLVQVTDATNLIWKFDVAAADTQVYRTISFAQGIAVDDVQYTTTITSPVNDDLFVYVVPAVR